MKYMKKARHYNAASHRQLSSLRYIADQGSILISDLRTAHQITTWSLLHRGWLFKPERDSEKVLVTLEGMQALEQFEARALVTRKNESDISGRVAKLLHLSAMLRVQKKSA